MELADGKFDTISQRVTQQTKNMRAISDFFTSTKREIENFSKGYQKAVTNFKTCYQQNGQQMDEWELAIAKIMKISEDFAKITSNSAQSVGFKVVEPYEIFIGHYEQSNKNFLKDGAKIIESLNAHRNRLKKIMDRIAKNMNDNVNDQVTYGEYKVQINTLNEFIDEYEPKYRAKVQFIMQNEENRIDFIRKLFCKYMEIFEDLARLTIKNKEIITDVMNTVKPIQVIENTSSNSPDSKPIPMKMFEKVIYEDSNRPTRKQSDASDNTAGLAQFSVSSVESVFSDRDGEFGANFELPKEDAELMKNTIRMLLDGKAIELSSKQKLIELCQYSDGRMKLCELFGNVTSKIQLPILSFKTFGEVINNLLTTISLYNDMNIIQLQNILSFSGNIATIKEGAQTYLRELISENSIWRSKERWVGIIQHRIDKSLSISEAQAKSILKEDEPKSIMQKIWSVGSKWITRKKPEISPNNNQNTNTENMSIKEFKEEQGKKSVVYSELSSAAVEIALMSVDPDLGRDILIHFALKYNIEQDKLFQLLSDYESCQPLQRDIEVPVKELEKLSLVKREKERKKFGYNKAVFITGLCLPFIDNDKSLRNLLLVNKEWNSVFRTHVFRVVLKNAYKTKGKRFKVWQPILTAPGFEKLYTQLKSASIEDFKKTYKQIDDVIKLDVSRSFHIYDEKDQMAIINILRCYAVFNPDIEYCQGMNFIAGFFYLIYHNESLAFSMLCTFIANLDLSYMFKQNVPMLRMFFYQMNRLLAIFLPRLHRHLFEEGINSTYFCSPWFLTGFTFVLQSAKTQGIPILLYDIFDHLLTVFFHDFCPMIKK